MLETSIETKLHRYIHYMKIVTGIPQW